MSLLVIDIGNTRLKWGLYAGSAPGAALLAHGAVVLEDIDYLWHLYWKNLPEKPSAVLGCVVAGEAIKRRVEEQLAEGWGLNARWVSASAQAGGVSNGYEHPQRLGADRWAAIIGARQRALQQAPEAPPPVLAVMVGTAVTVDAVDASGHFLGGLILPGFGLMYRALESGTAGLKVPTGEVRDFPTNTSDALMSGGTDAIAGAIERTLRRLRLRTGREPLLIMSGGAVSRLAHLEELQATVAENLIFEGLLTLADAGALVGASASASPSAFTPSAT
ncbi:MAG: type III pantothenate kinase [Proteobacteria bacterium]|uniref:type III pantothenate kinase n=1 Tax=Aquabacterium sp. TaxID=1872578 RepID=UPI0035C6BF23|nr:type III pantothenate kinase [Pseudomonadota bacterium]